MMRQTNTGQLVFSQDLRDLDVNKIKLVDRTENSSDLIERFHGYVPTTRYVGRQLNYGIMLEGFEIGFTGIGSAVMAMGPRDKFIGWTKQQRLFHLTNIANNWRYTLIDNLPKNTGSKVLSLVVDKARVDWKKKYGDELVMLETTVEYPRTGTVYMASGWTKVGSTVGTQYAWKRKDEVLPNEQIVRQAFTIGDKVDNSKVKVILGNTSPKEILVKPINKRWKKILCENPKCEECISFLKQSECHRCENSLTRAQIAYFNKPNGDFKMYEDDEIWDGVVTGHKKVDRHKNNKVKTTIEYLDIF
jgi:hypothetical protein